MRFYWFSFSIAGMGGFVKQEVVEKEVNFIQSFSLSCHFSGQTQILDAFSYRIVI